MVDNDQNNKSQDIQKLYEDYNLQLQIAQYTNYDHFKEYGVFKFVVYFNTGLTTYGPISELFSFYRHVIPEYHQNLDNVYIINPSVLVKGYTWWTKKQKQLSSKIVYVDTLDRLQQYEFFQAKYYSEIPEFIRKYNKSQGVIEEKKSQLQPIVQQTQQIGKNIEDFELNEIGIPVILEKLVNYFKNDSNKLDQQGIFRKSGFISDQNKLMEEILKKNYDNIYTTEDPYTVAGLIKSVFSKMPIPIFPFQQYEKLLLLDQIQDEVQQVTYVEQIIHSLPELNQLVLYYITEFFQLIVAHSSKNQMTIYNIAVVFAPCLLRSKQTSYMDLAKAGNMVNTIKLMIENCNQIFDEFKTIYQKSPIDSLTNSDLSLPSLVKSQSHQNQPSQLQELQENKSPSLDSSPNKQQQQQLDNKQDYIQEQGMQENIIEQIIDENYQSKFSQQTLQNDNDNNQVYVIQKNQIENYKEEEESDHFDQQQQQDQNSQQFLDQRQNQKDREEISINDVINNFGQNQEEKNNSQAYINNSSTDPWSIDYNKHIINEEELKRQSSDDRIKN